MIHRRQDARTSAAVRRAVGLVAFAAAALFILWKASNAVLLIFAGVLFGAFLDGVARLLGKLLPWSRGVRLAVVCAVLGAALVAAIASGSTAIAQQAGELATTLREQINQVLAWVQQHGIAVQGAEGLISEEAAGTGEREADTPTLRSLLPDLEGLFGTAWTAIALVVGGLGDAAVIAFVGIFFAAQPHAYRDALLLLVPPSRRGRVGTVLDEAGETLRHWLLGPSLTMSVIFLFTWLGLTLVGVGPAFVLGLQAGLLAFIPTLGPLVAGVPIMLAGFAGGLSGVIGALAVYTAVQTLESYLLTPMIQRRAIEVPPAFLFASQIVLGLLFGLYGVALATPLAAIARVFILRFYVEDALGDRRAEAG
ncbi:MAG TPA: AI-2E family transporter [Geminicoccaceae bacterium]|nr:AI-2E family transporter [Geminicoccaceae bacterium]